VESLITDTKNKLAALAQPETETIAPPAGEKKIDTRTINGYRLTWGVLAAWYRQRFLIAPEWATDGRTLRRGSLSYKTVGRALTALVHRLGPNVLVRTVTPAMLYEYRDNRIATPVVIEKYQRDPLTQKPLRDLPKIKTESERSWSSINHDMKLIRELLNHCVQNGWITNTPFRKDMVNAGKERKRQRTAKLIEENTLLAQCTDHKKRAHLGPYLTVLFDSGARGSELRRLLVRDCNFDTNEFVVYSYKGKGRHCTARPIGMTPRARVVMLECCAGKAPEDHVFTFDVERKHKDGTKTVERRPLVNVPKKAFDTAKRLAKWWSDDQIDLSDFRAHDIRHTTITRLVNSNQVSAPNIMKLTGHTQSSTFMRYVNPDNAERAHAANVLANYEERDNA
jgi:integrase